MRMPSTPNLQKIVLKDIVLATRRYTSPCINILDFLLKMQQTSVRTIAFYFVGHDLMEKGIQHLAADPLFIRGLSQSPISATLQRVEYHFQDLQEGVSLVENKDAVRELILDAHQDWSGRDMVHVYVK